MQLTRRGLIGSGAALALAAPAAAVPASPFAEGASLLVAGPSGGLVDGWVDWLSPGLEKALAPGILLRRDAIGGLDGVTAANQFEARAVPDGGTALLLPGTTAMAWLMGDPRARFDAAHWVPAMAAVTPALVVSRVPLPPPGSGPRLRVAALAPGGPELPAMLALDLMGVGWVPVFGLGQTAACEALLQQRVDVVCLYGRRVTETAVMVSGNGVAPIFTYGSVDANGQRERDPAFAGVPAGDELFAGHAPGHLLQAGWSAIAAASGLDMTLVLPQLTPAPMVALWRRACTQAIGSDALQAQAAGAGIRVLPSPAATAATAAVLADAATLLEFRQWLLAKLDYRPS